jgi:TonB family protein
MAQGSPISDDSSRFERQVDAGDQDWTELRAPSSRSPVRRGNRRLSPWLLVLIVFGGAAAALYFQVLQPASRGESATAPSNAEPPKTTVLSRSAKKAGGVRSSARSAASSTSSPVLQSGATAAVASAWPDVSPPMHVDVLTSSGHVPLRVSSLAYRVDIASGTVLLVRSGFGAPVATTPSFPIRAESKQALDKIEGTVVLRVMTDAAGKVREVQVVSGPPALAAAAIDAVRQWRFASPVDDGEPAEHDTTITISFKTSP